MLILLVTVITNLLLMQALVGLVICLRLMRAQRREWERRTRLGVACFPLRIVIPDVPRFISAQECSYWLRHASHHEREEWLLLRGFQLLACGYSLRETEIRLWHLRDALCPYCRMQPLKIA